MSDNIATTEQNDPVLDAILNNQPLPKSEQAPEQLENPVSAAPSAEPAKIETPENPEQAAPIATNDWITEANKTIGAEFKTVDEAKELFNKAKGYGDLESRLATMSQELESVKASSEVNPFANDYIKKLNELTQGGATADQLKLFNEINSIGEIKTLTPFEAKKLALRYEHDLTPEQAETMINNQYKLDESAFDKDIVEGEKIRLKVESQKDFKYLEDLQAKASENPAQVQQQEQDNLVKEYTAKISPIAKSIQDSFTVIKGVNLNGKQGADAITIDLPVSEESRAQIADLVTQHALMHNIRLDEKGMEHLNEFARNVSLISNWESMAIHIASKTEERIRAEFHNPSGIPRGDDNPADDKSVKDQQLLDFVLQ